jgi:hypothetical protein
MIWRITTLAVVGATFGMVGMWAADRESPTHIKELVIENSPVQIGTPFVAVFTVYRQKDCASKVERMMFDSQRVRYVYEDLQFDSSPGPIGVDDVYRVTLVVPHHASRGEARFRTQATYYCNLLHRFWPVKGEVKVAPFDITGDRTAIP